MILYYILCFFFSIIMIFFRVKREGGSKLPKGRLIIMSNHTSFFDIPLISLNVNRKVNYMAKAEAYKNPFIAGVLRCIGTFPVKRGEVDLTATKTALKLLNNEKVLCIFPEGTRNKNNDELQSVKGGVISFAIRSKSPIVPTLIYKRPKFLAKNIIIIGKPFELSQYYGIKMTAEQFDEAISLISNKFIELRADYEQRIKNKGNKSVEYKLEMLNDSIAHTQRQKRFLAKHGGKD